MIFCSILSNIICEQILFDMEHFLLMFPRQQQQQQQQQNQEQSFF